MLERIEKNMEKENVLDRYLWEFEHAANVVEEKLDYSKRNGKKVILLKRSVGSGLYGNGKITKYYVFSEDYSVGKREIRKNFYDYLKKNCFNDERLVIIEHGKRLEKDDTYVKKEWDMNLEKCVIELRNVYGFTTKVNEIAKEHGRSVDISKDRYNTREGSGTYYNFYTLNGNHRWALRKEFYEFFKENCFDDAENVKFFEKGYCINRKEEV